MRQGSTNLQSLFGMMAPNMLQEDTDGDGLPDWVETNTGNYNSSTDTGTAPNDPDTDDDGDWVGDEIGAGTDPNSGGSLFEISFLGPMTNRYIMTLGLLNPFEIRWCSVEGKTYYVSSSTNLLEGFSVIQGNILATPPVNSYIDTLAPETHGSYMIGVE